MNVAGLPFQAAGLTPTSKLKRSVVHANHADTIEELYAQR